MAKKQEKEVERWVTVNGARVPIFKDGSIGGPKELRDKLKKMDSFEKSQKGLYTNTSNAKEQVDMLKAELKKHSNDIHTNEIKARLKKAEDRYKKLKKGEDPDKDVFKTKKEWDEEDKNAKIADELYGKTIKAKGKDGKPVTIEFQRGVDYYKNKLRQVDESDPAYKQLTAVLADKGHTRDSKGRWHYDESQAEKSSDRFFKKHADEYPEMQKKKEQTKEQKTISKNDDLKEKQIANNTKQKAEANKQHETVSGRFKKSDYDNYKKHVDTTRVSWKDEKETDGKNAADKVYDKLKKDFGELKGTQVGFERGETNDSDTYYYSFKDNSGKVVAIQRMSGSYGMTYSDAILTDYGKSKLGKNSVKKELAKGRAEAANKHNEAFKATTYKEAKSNLKTMSKGELATIARKLGIPSRFIKEMDADKLRDRLLFIYKGSHK